MFASFQSRWWIVVASMSGLIVTGGTINVFAFAVFLKPVSDDLGIGRSVLASGLLVTNLVCGFATPFVGGLADRWGSHNILLTGIPLFALTIAAFSLLQASLVPLYILFALAGVFSAAQNTVPYAKVISNWFDRERGMALGLATAGVGLGVAVVPLSAQLLIQTHGWRMAYVGLGAMIVLFAFIPVVLFVREPSPGELPDGGHCSSQTELPGLTAKAAFTGQWRFWAIAAAYFVSVISTNGTLAQVVAMLTDRGISLQKATMTLSAAGLAMIVGRVLCGWCLDRFYGPRVAMCFQIVPALGLGGLASGMMGVVPLFGTLLLGLGLGAHVGLMAFFAGRYFGLKAYGKIYGTMFGVFLVGSGVGPYLGSLSFDLWHSYDPALIAFATGLLAASLLFAPLGPYPFASRQAAIASPPHVRQQTPLGAGAPCAEVLPSPTQTVVT